MLQPDSHRRAVDRSRWASLMKTLAVIAVIAVATIAGCYRSGKSGEDAAKRFDDAIRSEIPQSATRAQAEAWLSGRGITPYFYADTTGDKSGHQTMPMLAGLRDEDLSGMVRGEIVCPNEAMGITSNGRLSIYFFLGEHEVVVGHYVNWFEYQL